jgi:uncharacterized protein (TIGR03435 family)
MAGRISMTRILVAAEMLFTACIMFGQPAAPAKAFEVVSVKPNASGDPGSSTHSSKGQIRMENVSLKQCIERAFNVKDYSLSGPSWLDSVRFDIMAKPPAGYKPDDVPPMLQTLLVERFQLAVHRESKVLPAYALLVDKKGPKVQPVEEKDGKAGWGSGRGLIDVHSLTMAGFSDVLSADLDRPVADLTDLKGVFEFKLRWTPDETQPTSPDVPTATSLFAAVQEQLGLRLEARKLPIEILVIDHVEKVPTEN